MKNLYDNQEYWNEILSNLKVQIKKGYVKIVHCPFIYLNYKILIQNKIVGEKVNKFQYADDTILILGSNENATKLLLKIKEENIKANLLFKVTEMFWYMETTIGLGRLH